ncbi:MAG TPA: T9SS type A sorting domain-containing protein, partial [Ferruginibacter sp.]|nr:T9SS type A sorting domain-containing protein [Ferruginibacter sp.]
INGTAPCGSVTSFQRILTVNPLPTVVIAASPYTNLLPGLVTNLTSTVTPAAALSYSWLRNGVAVPGGTNASLSVGIDGLGDYTLRVTDVNGCTSTSNMISIKDSVSGKVFIYPNPNTGMFQVRYYSAANNIGLPRGIVVYDGKGERVFIQNYTIGRPYDRMDVDMRKLGTGVYWLEVVGANGNRLAIGRVVIVR